MVQDQGRQHDRLAGGAVDVDTRPLVRRVHHRQLGSGGSERRLADGHLSGEEDQRLSPSCYQLEHLRHPRRRAGAGQLARVTPLHRTHIRSVSLHLP